MINGTKTTCGMVCDVMTHSSTRGRGVFTELGRFSLKNLGSQGVGFVSGYPIRAEVLPGHLKVGWNVAFCLPLYAKVLKTNASLRRAGLAVFAPLANIM